MLVREEFFLLFRVESDVSFEQIESALAQRIDETGVAVVYDGFPLSRVAFTQEPESVGVLFHSFRHGE